MPHPLPKIIVICGPTGIGKTALTLDIYKNFPSIIISADSVQVYRHMNIGTAKLSPQENMEAPHELIDICDPNEDFDAGKFAELAEELIFKAHNENKISIITGGTGLYIRALTQGIFRSRPADNKVLADLYKLEEQYGKGHLHQKLYEVDPKSCERIHKNDTFRTARALECYISTGKPISQLQEEDRQNTVQKFKVLKLGLQMDRQALYQRIEQRVDIMMDQGLINEVKELRKKGYGPDLKSMGAIGYKHINMFLDLELSLKEAVSLMKRDTRRYAKRQLTWFNADKEIKWIAPTDLEKANKLIAEFLKSDI